MFQKSISIFLFILFILIIFISIFLNSTETSGYFNNNSEFIEDNSFHYNENSIFSWPLFGYYNISSFFGYRNSPTTGASSYHSGIDIPAPEGSNIYSICNGTVIFTGFYGADGYSIIIENQEKNLQIIYGHVSPNFIIIKNQIIKENEKIRKCWT